MLRQFVFGSVLLGAVVVSADNSSDIQKLNFDGMDNYKLNMDLGKKYTKRSKRARGLSVELFGNTNFDSSQKKIALRPNECYNVENVYSLRAEKYMKYKGALVACAAEDCNGLCRVMPRRISDELPDIFADLGNKTAVSVTWISPYY
ncbi:hypothetical protein AX774_g5323 [Zancudomyces culisetae]|uniref:Uncharacterized protein n=1 Tax=Zancudomyces culisetae TaxID=1213189 RepID=A0A1R1PK07_ZANCU|nr:hypothetical protein AX774_g5323 [Zancudomyces culisetae]|eukprot:OMH81222.1 hypothetical protein AX774_g5323 [Zancudomyces culisetae]